ncbi:hypothetical protein MJ585_22695 [Klebsiella pneumoniae]|nr:hypothetical protein MJ585_22695 [Klebsiella pneumoniae]
MLALDRHPSIKIRDMDYVEWLADTMIRVPVEHALDVVNGCRPVRPAGDQRPAGDDDPAERPYSVASASGAA